MIESSALILLLGLGTGLRLAAAQPQTAVAVVEAQDAAGRKLGQRVEKELGGGVRLRWLTYSEDQLGDPIYKGKLIAALEKARLVVAVGDDAAQLVSNEVEQAPIYFVSSVAAGSALADPRVAGTFTYSAQDLLSAMPRSWKRDLGILYTPGYEPVVAQIRALAKGAGVTLRERSVMRAGDVPTAARSLMSSSKAVWVLGDPVLSRGAGFEFLVEQSLSQSIPLIGAGRWEVSQGAALCSEGRDDTVAQQASHAIADVLASKAQGQKLGLAESGGYIDYNRSLQTRFELTPQPPMWRGIP